MSDEEKMKMSHDNNYYSSNTEDYKDYKDYIIDEGVRLAEQTEAHQYASKEKEKKFNMLIKMALPWQREVVEELIDEIKNHENERSSIEMESVIDLIYKEQKGKNE